MIVFYGHTKGGVDIVDLISSKLSVRIKSMHRTINALAFILDIVRTNTKTILRESANSNLTTFKFTRGFQALRSRGKGGRFEGAYAPLKFADNVPFFSESPLNVLFFENI